MWSEALSCFPKFVCHHFFSTTRCSEVGYGLSNSSERSVATSNFFSVTRTSLSDVFSNSLQRSSASPSPISHTPFAPGASFFRRRQESPSQRVSTSRQALRKKQCLAHFPFQGVTFIQALRAFIPSPKAAEVSAVCLHHHIVFDFGRVLWRITCRGISPI